MRPEGRLLAAFVIGRVHQKYALSYIKGGVAAVARWATERGVAHLGQEPVVVQALKVAAKRAVRVTVQKLPLSHQHLTAVVRLLSGWQPPELEFPAARDRALFLVGWSGMFRSSELVNLQWDEVHFFAGRGVALFVPVSKTDPGEGAWVFLAAAPRAARILCPVRALRTLQARTGGRGAVFPACLGAARPLSKRTVGPRLRKALERAGVPDSDLYAAHSLRRGGATHAARVGLSTRQIMTMGRWKSDSFRLYTYCNPDQLWQASKRVLQG